MRDDFQRWEMRFQRRNLRFNGERCGSTVRDEVPTVRDEFNGERSVSAVRDMFQRLEVGFNGERWDFNGERSNGE